MLNLDDIRSGATRVGPGTLTMFIPVLLPWQCCADATVKRCPCCGRIGYTHGRHADFLLRCFDCDTELAADYKDELRDQCQQ